MHKSTCAIFTVVLSLSVCMSLHAQSKQIYTWTDENGVVHYVDTPPDNSDAVNIEAPEAYRPGSAGAYPAADELMKEEEEDPELVESYAEKKRAQLAQDREQAAQSREETNKACEEARTRLEQLEPSRRVFYTNEQGETVRLDDEQRVGMVDELKQFIQENCG